MFGFFETLRNVTERLLCVRTSRACRARNHLYIKDIGALNFDGFYDFETDKSKQLKTFSKKTIIIFD